MLLFHSIDLVRLMEMAVGTVYSVLVLWQRWSSVGNDALLTMVLCAVGNGPALHSSVMHWLPTQSSMKSAPS
jgi:hypothetical protein